MLFFILFFYLNLFFVFKQKYGVPDDWAYDQARQLFKEPDVLSGDAVDVSLILFILLLIFFFKLQLKWTEPDEEGLIAYMVQEKGFG